MPKSWPRAILGGLLALALPACNGDDGGGGGGTQPPDNTVEVKSGTWDVTITLSPPPGQACIIAAPTSDTTPYIFCDEVDIDALANQFNLDCAIVVQGNQISGSCGGELPVLGCQLAYSGSGGGALSAARDSFSFTANLVITVKPGSPAQCGSGSCNLSAVMTGAWKSAEGCASAGETIRVPLETLVAGALAKGILDEE